MCVHPEMTKEECFKSPTGAWIAERCLYADGLEYSWFEATAHCASNRGFLMQVT